MERSSITAHSRNVSVNVHPHKFVFDHFEGVLSQKEWHLSPDLVIILCNIDNFTKLNDKCHSFCDKTP